MAEKNFNTVKKAALAKIEKLTERQVKSLVSWPVHRKKSVRHRLTISLQKPGAVK
jgi:hypothetical protein